MRLSAAAMVIAGCVGGLAGAQQAQTEAKATGLPANGPVLERVLREWPEGRVSTVKNPGENGSAGEWDGRGWRRGDGGRGG